VTTVATDLHPAVASYLARIAHLASSSHTLAAVQGDLHQLAVWFADQRGQPFDPTLLQARDVQAWRAAQLAQGVAPATINRRLSTLRSFVAWAGVSSGWQHCPQ
jgi:site-specific recombinase XerC